MLLNDFCCGLRTRAGRLGKGRGEGKRVGVGCEVFGVGAKVMRGSVEVGGRLAG